MAWFIAHWGTLLEIANAVGILATLVTGLTPSPKDDSVVSKGRKLLGRLGVATFADAPGSLKLPLASAEASPILVRPKGR